MLKIEHPKNEIFVYLENEVGSGVLQSSVQQTCFLREFQTTIAKLRNHNETDDGNVDLRSSSKKFYIYIQSMEN